MKFTREINIRIGLLVALLSVSIIPAVLVGNYANREYTRLVTNKVSDFTTQTVSRLNAELATELRRYAQFIDQVSVSEGVQAALAEKRGGIGIQRAVESIIIRSGYFLGLRVVGTDGTVLYDDGRQQLRISDSEFKRLMARVDEVSSEDCLYHVGEYGSGTLIVGRKIFLFPGGQHHVGYIFAFIDDAMPENLIFSNVSVTGNITLIDSRGNVLAGSDLDLGANISGTEVYSNILNVEREGKNAFTVPINGESSFVAFSYNAQYDSYLFTAEPLSLIESTRQETMRIVTLSVILVAACVALSVLIYRIVVADMKRMDKRKRELEMEALQYQINPHFLFNTLGTLKWAAVINEAPAIISDGITSLSQLLRSVLLNKDEMVPLQEELDNLAHYFTIQKIRYGDCFEVVEEIDANVLTGKVPRFILQPLAENAVLHGSESGERKIEIIVRCYRQGDNILLEIKDNGRGFDVSGVKDSASRFSGIGISNVDERLKLYFGSEYGLIIKSQPGEGTLCRVLVPVGGKESRDAESTVR